MVVKISFFSVLNRSLLGRDQCLDYISKRVIHHKTWQLKITETSEKYVTQANFVLYKIPYILFFEHTRYINFLFQELFLLRARLGSVCVAYVNFFCIGVAYFKFCYLLRNVNSKFTCLILKTNISKPNLT